MKHPQQARYLRGEFNHQRAKIIAGAFGVIFVCLIVRAYLLQLSPDHASQLRTLAERQYEAVLPLASYRGEIFDRNGQPLAISLKQPSIAVNPRAFSPTRDQIEALVRITKLPEAKISRLAKKKVFSLG